MCDFYVVDADIDEAITKERVTEFRHIMLHYLDFKQKQKVIEILWNCYIMWGTNCHRFCIFVSMKICTYKLKTMNLSTHENVVFFQKVTKFYTQENISFYSIHFLIVLLVIILISNQIYVTLIANIHCMYMYMVTNICHVFLKYLQFDGCCWKKQFRHTYSNIDITKEVLGPFIFTGQLIYRTL